MWLCEIEVEPVCTPPCAPHAVCREGNSCECSVGFVGNGSVCSGKEVGALPPYSTPL